MKTLYINLNGENIVSSNDVVVVGTEKDNIINKFYITLGTEICDGVIVKGVKKKQLVTEFENEHPQDFKSILDQWDEIRYKLLGNNPTGEYSIKIPNAYLEWLQYHQNSEYRRIYTQKYNKRKDVKVEIDIKDLYNDTVELIISNIEPDDYNKIVVDDDFVTKKSAIVQSIKEEYPKIAFVPFEEFERPCEEPLDGTLHDEELCSNYGKEICECEGDEETGRHNDVSEIEKGNFCYDDITIGKTTLSELRKKGYRIHRGYWRYDNKRSYVSEFPDFGDYCSIVIDNWAYNDIDEWCDYFFVNPSAANIETLKNTNNVVTYFHFSWNACPFLYSLGFYGDDSLDDFFEEDNDDEEELYDSDDDSRNEVIAAHIASLFEERGYIQIESFDSNQEFTLVNKKPNSNGDYIFIGIDATSKFIYFYVNIVKEWVDLKTGKHYTTRNKIVIG